MRRTQRAARSRSCRRDDPNGNEFQEERPRGGGFRKHGNAMHARRRARTPQAQRPPRKGIRSKREAQPLRSCVLPAPQDETATATGSNGELLSPAQCMPLWRSGPRPSHWGGSPRGCGRFSHRPSVGRGIERRALVPRRMPPGPAPDRAGSGALPAARSHGARDPVVAT